MADHYSERDIKTVAAWMRDAAVRLEMFGTICLTSTTPNFTVSGPSNDRVSGGGVGDPTGMKATVNITSNAWLEREQAHLNANIGHALDISQAIVTGTGRIYDHVTPERGDDDPDDRCRQGCGDPPAPGYQGNCRACAQWLHRHRDADGLKPLWVPTHVIDERKAGRAKKKAKSLEGAA